MDFVYTFLLLAFFSFISFIIPYFYSKKRISKLKKEIVKLNESKYMKIQGKIIDFEEHYYVKKGQACDYYYFHIVSCNYLGEDYILKVNTAIQSYSFWKQSKPHKDKLPLSIGDNIKIECKFDEFSAFVALSKSTKEPNYNFFDVFKFYSSDVLNINIKYQKHLPIQMLKIIVVVLLILTLFLVADMIESIISVHILDSYLSS